MKQILFALLFFSAPFTYAQSFEGTLTYVSEFEISEKMIKMGMTKQILLDDMKKDGLWSDTIKVSYKQGNYYTLLNNDPKTWSFYNAKTNKIYEMQEGEASGICTVTDASIDVEYTMTKQMPSFTQPDTIVNINGIPCSIVRVTWGSGTYDYYYNTSKLHIDPALFAKHIHEGWAGFLKISHSLPIRIVKSVNGMMSVTMTLVSEKAEPVDDKLFAVPTLVADKELNAIKIPNKEMMRIKK